MHRGVIASLRELPDFGLVRDVQRSPGRRWSRLPVTQGGGNALYEFTAVVDWEDFRASGAVTIGGSRTGSRLSVTLV